ncbi:HlyD family secretion protein [Halomonas huangheensis]|uniref:Membrane fusion protein biotin-lipoyl like domain-containing protein n=1 Tax=Halomonas huangheensis TaxID=1178482 RepID=W1ND78_9GAMM|nr:HlyD family secretion protein [Halomonas huangheensis]ALM52798.1 secretion protein HlyD [Halomonas huangheensis]ERL53291.1 hypothetical protein BJB45_18640 [Halomonas huangheensis]
MAGKKVVALGLVAVIAVVAGVWKGVEWWQVGRFIEETDNAYVQSDSVTLRAEISARITAIPVEDNQRVAAGEVLVQLDDSDAGNQLAQAQAERQVAEAGLVQAQRQRDRQQAAIAEAQAQVEAAEAQVVQAQRHVERSQSLESRQYASQQQRQDDEAELRVATSTLAARRASLLSAQRQLDVADADIESAKANIEAAQAAEAVAQHHLTQTRIVASRAGVVGAITAEVGDLAQPSLTLMHLVPVEAAYVIANYKETQTERMRIGQPVSLHVDAYPDLELEGVVDSIAPATGAQFSLLPQDNATGNFNKIVQRVPVKIRLTGPDEALGLMRAGLSVIPEVDTHNLDGDALAVRPEATATGVDNDS